MTSAAIRDVFRQPDREREEHLEEGSFRIMGTGFSQAEKKRRMMTPLKDAGHRSFKESLWEAMNLKRRSRWPKASASQPTSHFLRPVADRGGKEAPMLPRPAETH